MIADNSRVLSATLLALLMSFGITSIVGNVHDIYRYGRKEKAAKFSF